MGSRGPKPGTRHEGNWKPGVSGNPGGRPKKQEIAKNAEKLAQERTPEMVEVLSAIALDGDAPKRERISAAETVLAYGLGKPVDRKVIAEMGSGGLSGARKTNNSRLLALYEKEQGIIDVN